MVEKFGYVVKENILNVQYLWQFLEILLRKDMNIVIKESNIVSFSIISDYFHYTTTAKGALVVQDRHGFTYSKNISLKNGGEIWCCSKRKTFKCSAALTIHGNFIKKRHKHSHNIWVFQTHFRLCLHYLLQKWKASYPGPTWVHLWQACSTQKWQWTLALFQKT